ERYVEVIARFRNGIEQQIRDLETSHQHVRAAVADLEAGRRDVTDVLNQGQHRMDQATRLFTDTARLSDENRQQLVARLDDLGRRIACEIGHTHHGLETTS